MEGLRKVVQGLHITVKINCSDFYPDGLNENDSLEICKIIADKGVDLIEVSGNGTSRQGVRKESDEAYFSHFAMRIAEEVDIPVIPVGGIRSKRVIEEILNKTKIELISLSRPLIR